MNRDRSDRWPSGDSGHGMGNCWVVFAGRNVCLSAGKSAVNYDYVKKFFSLQIKGDTLKALVNGIFFIVYMRQ